MTNLSLNHIPPLDTDYLDELSQSEIRLRLPDSEDLPKDLSGCTISPSEFKERFLGFVSIWGNAVQLLSDKKYPNKQRARALALRAQTALTAMQQATEFEPDFDSPDPDLYLN